MYTKLSIIMPVYNVEMYLKKSISSILDQSYQDFELLLINDASTDSSGEICKNFEQNDNRVRYFEIKENKGVSFARNIGLQQCVGEYVAFIDSDDWIESQMFKKMITLQEEHKADLVVCGANNIRLRDDGSIIKYSRFRWRFDKNTCVYRKRDIIPGVYSVSATVWNKLFRKELLTGIVFDEGLSYGEDNLFVLEYMLKCELAVVCKDTFYNYFINRPGNVVSAKIDYRSIEFLDNVRYIKQILADNSFYDVGISRIIIAIDEVRNKLISLDEDEDIQSYLIAIKKTIRDIPIIRLLRFFYINRFKLRKILVYLSYRINPKIWIKYKMVKKRKNSKTIIYLIFYS